MTICHYKNIKLNEVSDLEQLSKKHNTKIAVGIIDKGEIDELLKQVGFSPNKSFDQYLIAYVDFLGIKEKMNKENSYESLFYLKVLLSDILHKATSVKNINTIDDFKIKVFSDNIVIAQKIKADIIDAQIISIINLISLLQFEAFFQFDFSLRGGVTIGDLYIDDEVVWGTGLIEAYQIEDKLANYPRVIVSQKVICEYERCQEKSLNLYSMIKQDIDGYWFIDYLLAVPNIRIIPLLSDSLANIASLHTNDNDRVKQKINWVISYFNSYCCRFADRGDYEKVIVPYI